eukprot:7246663-Heterocapsa_arctica.AAC.1
MRTHHRHVELPLRLYLLAAEGDLAGQIEHASQFCMHDLCHARPCTGRAHGELVLQVLGEAVEL